MIIKINPDFDKIKKEVPEFRIYDFTGIYAYANILNCIKYLEVAETAKKFSKFHVNLVLESLIFFDMDGFKQFTRSLKSEMLLSCCDVSEFLGMDSDVIYAPNVSFVEVKTNFNYFDGLPVMLHVFPTIGSYTISDEMIFASFLYQTFGEKIYKKNMRELKKLAKQGKYKVQLNKVVKKVKTLKFLTKYLNLIGEDLHLLDLKLANQFLKGY